MRTFQHTDDIWREFPALSAGVVVAPAVNAAVDPQPSVTSYLDQARERLALGREGERAEVQAWRRAYTQMGLKATQYRSAAESLLRRLRTASDLPSLHPFVDLCNAISAAYAIPIAVFDLDRVVGSLTVKHADGTERYMTFLGETEQPAPGEVIFADDCGNAHARRWVNRQSGLSAVRPETSAAVIVAEAVHGDATDDIDRLLATLTAEVTGYWGSPSTVRQLSAENPQATLDPR